MAIIGHDIRKAKECLLAGKIVAIPTETVYGLAGNGYNPDVVASIFTVKERPSFDPLIVHTDSLHKAICFVAQMPPLACRLAKWFWPGPLTLLLPKRQVIPDLVTAGSHCVGVRIPNHLLTLRLLQVLPFPLAAPSANPFGYISPTTAQHVADQFGHKIAYILDGGACAVGVESTIVSFDGDKPTIRRLGGITRSALEQVVGPMAMQLQHPPHRPCIPGALFSHYAPKKRLVMGELSALIAQYHPIKRVGILSFQTLYPEIPAQNQVLLSPKGCLEEAAKNLFQGLRLLDVMDIDLILGAYVPNHGIGEAVNDRLRRAQSKLC